MAQSSSLFRSVSQTLLLLLNTPLVEPDSPQRAPTAYQLNALPAQPSPSPAHPGIARATASPRTQPDRLAEEGMAHCIPAAARQDRQSSVLGPRPLTTVVATDDGSRDDTEPDLVVHSSAASSTSSEPSSVSTQASAPFGRGL